MHHRNGRHTANSRQLERARIDLREQAAVEESSAEPGGDDVRASLLRLFCDVGDECARRNSEQVEAHRQCVATLIRKIVSFDKRLERLETMIEDLHELAKNATPTKDWYSVSEVADVLGRAEFTVREWCRLGRVHAAKRECGRGNSQEWIVSHEELIRIQNDGLLPE